MPGEDMSRLEAEREIGTLEKRFADRMEVNPDLNRQLVSFQANKSEPIFRWFKYREGFSRDLIDYCLDFGSVAQGQTVLDPFAGTGATAFTSLERGANGIALELLPVGAFVMKVRHALHVEDGRNLLRAIEVIERRTRSISDRSEPFSHLRITDGAFPEETEVEVGRYRAWVMEQEADMQPFLIFVLMSILEEISYTRKDGQYLRWDSRADRRRTRSNFDKGEILSFDEAISRKITQIRADLSTYSTSQSVGSQKPASNANPDFQVIEGSNFHSMSLLRPDSVDLVFTSPPYCNRYDYTRTYALELALLEVSELRIRQLRQDLLTCTVENREKDLGFLSGSEQQLVVDVFSASAATQSILRFLETEAVSGRLNNRGIVTMVRGYLLETIAHLYQASKVIRTGGRYMMVNDNVQYNGLPIPIDCLLSSYAEELGFRCELIWVLPKGKGNSSQQMKVHGRRELRKCVYSWVKVR